MLKASTLELIASSQEETFLYMLLVHYPMMSYSEEGKGGALKDCFAPSPPPTHPGIWFDNVAYM